MPHLHLSLLLPLLIASSASAVTMDWTPVGNPGNPADTRVMSDGTTGYGAVGYSYDIGTYEVTNAQYVEFLNAVAVTDSNALYNPQMAYSGITRTGNSGSYTYSAISGSEQRPAVWVSFPSTLRFANWLQNGQRSGAQDATATEDGAYTMSQPNGNTITRNPGAQIFLPSENEWYKAAYYDALSVGYFEFPTGSSLAPDCTAPTAAANSANCDARGTGLTDVGSFTGSPSPYGTFDQGGNAYEWNEGIFLPPNGRSLRGGSYYYNANAMRASERFYAPTGPYDANYDLGFRLAMIPEPGTGLLVIAGLLGLAGWRRSRH